MRIACFADTHIGYSPAGITKDPETGLNTRYLDGLKALEETVTQILEEDSKKKIALVLLPGDLFHSPTPDVRTVSHAIEQVSRLSREIPTIVTAGNHDSPSELNLKIPATWVLNSIPGVRCVNDSIEQIEILPGVMVTAVSHQAAFEYKNDISGFLKKVEPQNGLVNIFTGHGTSIDLLTGSRFIVANSPREVEIPGDVIYNPDWNAVVLGHIHSRTTLKDDKSRFYCGSAFRRGFSDDKGKRGWSLLTMDDKTGKLESRKDFDITQRPQFNLPVIDASKEKDLGEAILKNLDGIEVQGAMIRQKVENVSPGQRAGLDPKIFKDATKTAIYKSLELNSKQEKVEDIKEEQPKNSLAVEGFSDWLKQRPEPQETQGMAKGYVSKAWEEKLSKLDTES